MASPPLRVVWILGSGFSRHVGGPLLNELLSAKGRSIVSARFYRGEEPYPEVRDTFARHLRQGLHLWENAEEFLDLLDQARENAGLARLITGKSGAAEVRHVGRRVASPIEFLWEEACRAVGDECRFCDGAATDGEAWKPYKRWKESLGDGDLIVTFNYDRVLETLGLTAPPPAMEMSEEPVMARTVYKLHGSVDWERSGEDVTRATGRDHTPFLATPGPTKFRHTNDEGPLAPLWSAAAAALVHAEAVVFMGYRFPPTDSHALSSIFGALQRNERSLVRVFTVLGPRVHDDDTIRLKELLLRALQHRTAEPDNDSDGVIANDMIQHGTKLYSLRVLPLYAQDYMATMNRWELG